ncbi:MAG: hypothetical protein A2X34_08120 [Elusimicrobia bacterium GWC2_51_8]|nr:MAG: hypothetical protein A2X33_03260 [Elusimicrobia bacterium GWA2_51_34]OGR65214.1 MAG: hypothetical protein A2X34_08120 [Elusimicrobia bacterium GWC2_51_8]OGR84531.1 MAG: hypothetical protein A2021_05160 [Elusimicrobia bacterium GWF2_52_66]HCE98327.1 hypothetical protein [Elusimicrobiota bacterium]
MLKFFSLCVLAVAVGYCSVLYWPGIFFNNRFERGNFIMVSRSPIPDSAGSFAEKASYKLKTSQLSAEGQTFEVYAAASAGEYAFFAPFCRKDYACLHPLKDIIFMAPADFEKGLVASPLNSQNFLSLEKLLAREAVQLQIRREMTPLSYILADNWKKDGYAEHVASLGDYEPYSIDICRGDPASDPERAPYLYRLAVEYMMAEDKLSALDFIATDLSAGPAIKILKSRSCK